MWRSEARSSDPYKQSNTSSISMEPLVQRVSHVSNNPENIPSFGVPTRKRAIDYLDLAAVVLSFLCVVVGVAVVTPRISLAWKLGYANQIIVVGFVLGIMNLCLHRVLPTLLVLLEATWGPSRLQNYDAILANKFFASYTSLLWRIVVILLTALPLGLSVAYKRFVGGHASTSLKPLGGKYGTNFPNIGSWAPPDDPVYLQITSYAPYWAAAKSSNQSFPAATALPMAYGYNTLLLNESAAAVIDVPMPEYISEIQSRLRGNESWQVSAEVEGYLATLNPAYETIRANDSFWKASLTSTPVGLTAFGLYMGYGSMIGMAPYAEHGQCWISIYYNGSGSWSYFVTSAEDIEALQFRKTAQLYDVYRRRFNAVWDINATSMVLSDGELAAESRQSDVSQDVVFGSGNEPFTVDAMPDLPHTFREYVQDPSSSLPEPLWLKPSYAVTIATSYWARAVYLIVQGNKFSNYSYQTGSEHVISTRGTLDASPWLYVVLIVQPLLTLLAFGFITLFHYVPIDKGFGMISILAGVDKSSLPLLKGAALSGTLSQPLTVNIIPQQASTNRPNLQTDSGEFEHQVVYHLSTTSKKEATSRLQKHVLYH